MIIDLVIPLLKISGVWCYYQSNNRNFNMVFDMNTRRFSLVEMVNQVYFLSKSFVR